jgi:hypothetical protein
MTKIEIEAQIKMGEQRGAQTRAANSTPSASRNERCVLALFSGAA